jgi:hypothetical protein
MMASSPTYFTDIGKNLGGAVYVPQSGGTGAMHHKLPGASSAIPTIQYLLPASIGRVQATVAAVIPLPGRSSIRNRRPFSSGRGERTPHPCGFTINV